jgi:signal transduction histidine kinase
MATFLKKSWVKAVGYVLCATCLTAGLICGALVCGLVYSDSYSGGSLAKTLVQDMMHSDSLDIMMNYFDPADPTHPWVSYFSGGFYDGDRSCMVYEITDDNDGTVVLSTYDGTSSTFWSSSYTHSYEVTSTQEDPITITDSLFTYDGTIYAYDSDYEAFLPMDTAISGYVDAPALPEQAEALGCFYYQGMSYVFDGYGFYVSDAEVTYMISSETKTFTITCFLLSSLPYPDSYRTIYYFASDVAYYRYPILVAACVCLVLGLGLLILLGLTLGRVNGQEEPVVGPMSRLPPDLALILCLLLGFLGLLSLDYILASLYSRHMIAAAALILGLTLGLVVVGTYFILTLCVREKTHTLVSASVLHRGGRKLTQLAGKLLRYLPLLWKVAIAYGILCLLELFGLYLFFWGSSGLYVLWFLEKLVLGALVAYVALAFHRLKCGAEAIAAGDYNTQVDETHLVLDFKDSAETLNHIQDGMSAAVDSRMKSERLKTELITNVSHDLKTPLTSIVSYVDLLKQEPTGSPAAGEYLEVLDRQSARLKKLIEDLVEASKASTGNITVQAEALDLSLLLGQALGEYNERLLTHQLTPVIKAPEAPVTVFADGRLLWRIFDNLLGNAVKYALPGTRLYVTVTADTQATVTFRNISREPLDVSADELMERFVRGDSSRHTEGSGLGLSIARSLSESMGGTFQLSLDGDLFKATVSFPLASENSALEPQA